MNTFHHDQCEWHLDQYDFECTCGLTRPQAPWFQGLVERAAQYRVESATAALKAIRALPAAAPGTEKPSGFGVGPQQPTEQKARHD